MEFEAYFYFINELAFGDAFKAIPKEATVRFLGTDDNILAAASVGDAAQEDDGQVMRAPTSWLTIDEPQSAVLSEKEFLELLDHPEGLSSTGDLEPFHRFIVFGLQPSPRIATKLKTLGFTSVLPTPTGFISYRDSNDRS